MAKNLTVDEKLEVLKSYGVDVEFDRDGVYRVLNHQEVFNIFEIGNSIGDCTMEVTCGYGRNNMYSGHIYFVGLKAPWLYAGIQAKAREIGNEDITGVSFSDEREEVMSIDTIYYKVERS